MPKHLTPKDSNQRRSYASVRLCRWCAFLGLNQDETAIRWQQVKADIQSVSALTWPSRTDLGEEPILRVERVVDRFV